VATIDVHGNLNKWNNKTAEITGFPKKEAFNKPPVATFIVPKLWHSVQNLLDSALKGNETSNYKLEFRTKTNRNVNEWNGKTAEITGFSKEEALDKHLVSTFSVPKPRTPSAR
jgi:PAS domain-containing protein